MPVLSLKKEIAQLEKYKIKKTHIRYMLMPFAIAGFLMMIMHNMNFSLNFLSMLPLFLMVLVFLSSMYITFKYSIYERFKRLNKDIDEIERLEKE
jgi:ABC-type multidrug transport system fused ATPase/permease subunit